MRVSHLNTVYDLDINNIEEIRGADGKFHYFYKIVNDINNHFYYGVHSTENLNDRYEGSGFALPSAYKKYGKENFTKHILEFFDDRKSLLEYEECIVNKELLNNPKCYNLIEGGKSSYELGNHDSEYLIHTTLGLVHINDGIKNKLIKSSELQYYLSNGWTKGQTHKSCKNKIVIHDSNMNEMFIYPEEFEKYENLGWERGGKSRNKGQKSFCKGYVWINDGKLCKRIIKEELQYYLDNGWTRGSIQKFIKGYVRITNGLEDKNIPPENTEELQYYLDNGWRIGSHANHKNRIWIHKDGKDMCIKIEDKQKYLSEGWEEGRLYKIEKEKTVIGRNHIFKDDIIKIVKKEELQQYLNDGWKMGNPKNKKPSHNKNKIRVHNGSITKTISKEELQQYLNEGWIKGCIHKKSMKGKIRINNGVNEKLVSEAEFETYDKTIWKRGLIKPRKS